MGLLSERGYNRKTVETARGRFVAYSLAPDVFVTQIVGHMEPAVSDAFIAFGNARLAERRDKKLRLFHDWTEMTGYESSCRRDLTEWSLKHLSEMVEIRIATHSKIVAMGVQVANLALGGVIKAHTRLADLEAAVAAAVPGSAKPAS